MNELDKAIMDINKRFKTEILRTGSEYIYVEKIPFSSPRANYMTYGGVPIGKATEFLGAESGGKTTSALIVCGQAQKKAVKEWTTKKDTLTSRVDSLGERDTKSAKDDLKKYSAELVAWVEKSPKKVVFFDLENTLDDEWAELNGVDIQELIIARPQDHTAEQILQMVLDIIDSGLIELLVIDSLPMLVSKQIYEETLDKKSYGGMSAVLTEFSKRVSAKLSRHHTSLIGINQVREDFDNPYNIYSTPGGRAWKHLCALRLFFKRGSYLDENNEEQTNSFAEPKGNMVDITVVKTKVCKPDRRLGQYTLKYDAGVDILSDTVFMAIKNNYIVQGGSWYSLIDPGTGEILEDSEGNLLKFQGKTKLLEYLRTDEVIFQELYEAVNQTLKDA